MDTIRVEPALRVAVIWRTFPHHPEWTEAFETAFKPVQNATSIRAYLEDEALDHLYRQSRCLVSTSSYEGFQNPVMEAYLRGTRVVLPDYGHPLGPLLLGADGVHYYRAGDSTALRRAIHEATEAGSFRVSDDVRRRVGFRTVGEQLRAIYEEVQSCRPRHCMATAV